MRHFNIYPFILTSLLGIFIFQGTSAAKHPQRVIVETDMGNDIDDALALDLLYKAADTGKVEILGISNHKKSEYASTYIDILNTWYGYPAIPIAKSSACIGNNEAPDYTEAVCKMTDNNGKPLFHGTKKASDIEESVSFYRRILSKQPNRSVVIISLGFATNLDLLLKSNPDKYSKLTGKELVARKVKFVSMMAGSFGTKARAEFNVVNDIPAMQNFFSEWPTKVVLNPFEIGKTIVYPAKSIEDDFKWTTHHPVVEGYTHYHKMPYNRPTWDILSVLYLLHPEMLTIEEKGFIHIDKNGFTIFEPSSSGKHYILSITPEQSQKAKDYIVKGISQPPMKMNKSIMIF